MGQAAPAFPGRKRGSEALLVPLLQGGPAHSSQGMS